MSVPMPPAVCDVAPDNGNGEMDDDKDPPIKVYILTLLLVTIVDLRTIGDTVSLTIHSSTCTANLRESACLSLGCPPESNCSLVIARDATARSLLATVVATRVVLAVNRHSKGAKPPEGR